MGTGAELTIQIDARNGVTRFALTGELDLATVSILDHQLKASERNGAIVLDLRDLRFIDSSGLHALLGAYNRSQLNGHRLLLVGANPTLRRLCEITGTEFILDAEGTAELIARFTGDGSRTGDGDGEAAPEPHV